MKILSLFVSVLFSVVTVQAQEWQWAQQFDASNADRSVKMATDARGYTTMIGSFQGADLVWGNDTLPDISSLDYFVAQADAEGNPVWSLHGISKIEKFNFVGTFYDIDVDAEGNVYLAGTFVDTLRMGGEIIFSDLADSLNNSQIFYAKITSAGEMVYLKNADSDQYSWCTNISHNARRTYISGTYRGTIEIDGNLYDSGGANATAFVAEVDGQGEIVWLTKLPSISLTEVDGSGRLHLLGSFSDSIRLGNALISSPFRRNFYYAQMTPNGDWIVETFLYGGVGSNENSDRITLTDVEINENGEAAITGFFKGAYLEINDEFVTQNNDKTQFVIQLDASGNVRWVKDVAGIEGSWVLRPQIDVVGSSVYFFSTFEGQATIGDQTLFSKGGTDAVLAILDEEGEVQFTQRYGDTGFDFGYGISANKKGDVWLYGNYANYIEFDRNNRLLSKGSIDVFLAKADFSEITSVFSPSEKLMNATVFPNPGTDVIELEGNKSWESCTIYNVDGKIVSRSVNSGSKNTVSIAHLPRGSYTSIWSIADERYVASFIKI